MLDVEDTGLVESYYDNERDIFRYLLLRLKCAFTAKDLLQETFIKIESLENPAAVGNPRAYIFKVAVNLASDYQRAEKRHAAVLDDARDFLSSIGESHSPERILMAREEVARVRAAIEALSPMTRQVFAMNRFEGKTQREIAGHFGVSTVAIEKHIRKALAALSRAREGI